MADPVTLRVLVPEATTNYILNPAFRYDETGWTSTNVATTRTRTLDQARFNIASLKVVTSGTVMNEGVFYRVSSLSGVNEPITVSVYLRGDLGNEVVRLRFRDNAAGQERFTDPVILRKDRWTRLEVTGQSYGGNDLRLYVETADLTAKVITFYVDGAQMERKAYATSYCDGDQPGCQWNIVSHGSVSTRLGDTREGGRWVRLAGPCAPDGNDDIYVTVVTGLGMAPVSNSIQSWALSPGSFYQSTKINDRVVILNFNVKNEQLDRDAQPDLSPLHRLRQQLIDVFKPDLTSAGQPFLFEYKAGDYPVYVWLRYEAGLDGSWDIRNAVINIFPVRLLAVSPLMFEDNQNVKQLDFLDTIPYIDDATTPSGLLARIGGVWQNVNLPSPSRIYGFGLGGNQELYLGGLRGGVGNILPAISKWDGSIFTTIANGAPSTNGNVICFALAPNGDIYAGGDFTQINGVAANRIAKYSGGAWSALGVGVDDICQTICVAPNGQIYAGGNFHNAGGIAVNHIARWDGLQWRVVGTPAGLNDTVYSIINGIDGQTIYVGGIFTAASAGPLLYPGVASVSISTNLFTNIGTPPGTSVESLAIGKDCNLYACGSLPVGFLGVYNGRQWKSLGGTPDNTVQKISVGEDGSIYAVGRVTLFGSVPVSKLGRWISGVWCNVDLKLNGTSALTQVFAHPNGNLFVGTFNYNASSFCAGITTVNNAGTTEVAPILYLKGPGILHNLENQTAKKRCYFNLTLLPSEEVFIDFGRGTIKSTVRGDLLWTLLSPSDFKAFTLLPGDNTIAAFMTDDVNGLMQISYVPAHWSGDSTVTPEAL